MSLKKMRENHRKTIKKERKSSVLHIPATYKADLDVIEFHLIK
jgi:hypothetical protein